MSTILVIDDDRSILHLLERALEDGENVVATSNSASHGLALARERRPDVVLLDVKLPEMSGLELYREIREIDAKVPVIFITAGSASDTAIEAMKLGAYDYVLKPLDVAQVKKLVDRALEIRRLMQIPVGVPTTDSRQDGDLMVGSSPEMQDVYKAVGRVAPQDVTVLIHGESGTGKELVARAIYQHSHRAEGPFLAVNCAALTETLLESELFGHEKGSFTGAQQRRIGKFEQCSGGTIFLDEIGDMSPLVQSKVLRLLQEQSFERVGGNETIETDVRIIAATNRDLESMVVDGEFREDLYYRLNGFTIRLPPLRDRKGDVVPLINYCLGRFARELGKDVQAVSPDAMGLLVTYHWPGNVRELQSAIRQAMVQATGPMLLPEFLPEPIRSQSKPRQPTFEGIAVGGELHDFIRDRMRDGSRDLYAETLRMMERQLLAAVLKNTDGNQSHAAKLLGITRGSLRNKIRALGISLGHTVTVDEEEAEALRV